MRAQARLLATRSCRWRHRTFLSQVVTSAFEMVSTEVSAILHLIKLSFYLEPRTFADCGALLNAQEFRPLGRSTRGAAPRSRELLKKLGQNFCKGADLESIELLWVSVKGDNPPCPFILPLNMRNNLFSPSPRSRQWCNHPASLSEIPRQGQLPPPAAARPPFRRRPASPFLPSCPI